MEERVEAKVHAKVWACASGCGSMSITSSLHAWGRAECGVHMQLAHAYTTHATTYGCTYRQTHTKHERKMIRKPSRENSMMTHADTWQYSSVFCVQCSADFIHRAELVSCVAAVLLWRQGTQDPGRIKEGLVARGFDSRSPTLAPGCTVPYQQLNINRTHFIAMRMSPQPPTGTPGSCICTVANLHHFLEVPPPEEKSTRLKTRFACETRLVGDLCAVSATLGRRARFETEQELSS